MVAGLNEAEAGFRRALERLEQGKAARDRVDAGDLRGPLAPAATALVKFDLRYQPLHDNALLLAQLPEAARQVLGMEGARTYAVLGQNSAELRPTGGFIGSMGLITLENGALVREDYRSSYSFDNYERGFEPLPPAMATHIGFGGWAVRDANWSPDFPTTARKVEDLLGWHQGIAVDGVFGFTTYTVGGLLDALGPLNVPGFPEPLTSAGWYALAEQLIYRDPTVRTIDDLHQNKGEVLGPVLQAIVGRMQSAGADELPRLLRTLQALVQQRQLLIAFHDPAPATMAALYQADGRFAPPDDGDVLALNDANLSYSKVGPYIDERIEYDVWLDARGVAQRSRVTVTYTNRVTTREAVDPVKRIGGLEFDAATETVRPNPGVYGTYARLYLPAGSELLEASDAPTGLFSASDLGFTTLERYYSVPAASQRGFSYTYRIPAERALDGAYRLRVLKQPGTPGHALEVRVHLPEGVAAAPSLPMTREGDALVYRGQLITPLALELQIGERSP